MRVELATAGLVRCLGGPRGWFCDGSDVLWCNNWMDLKWVRGDRGVRAG